ncbi:ROK family protein [Puia dinghuensis]|uniref:Transcriptional regulator n=1 Tax=Puia dinghuensis TaxID=1792502 RepID=A0A8J2UCY5_9BACT|nr:ROK family protein [Puia dinghuensis]GGA97478.1 transcriptional regulator [Puia dinghuensis]
MREKNLLYKGKIIKELYFAGALSCSDLSTQIKTSLPLTTKMVNELIRDNEIVETGYAPSTGGRRPQMYSIRPDWMYTVAVAMDQLFTRIVIMDMQRHPVSEPEKIELHLARNPLALETFAATLDEHILKSGISRERIAGIGIGMPGFIDSRKGLNYSFLGNGERSITRYITDKVNVQTYIENDSSLIALAELSFGAARHKKTAMVVNLGWGIGLGLIINGELFRGYNGFAGEFSHLPLFTNNKLCSCGKMGCLETEASLMVVVEKAKEGIRNGRVTLLQEKQLADDLDQASKAVISAAGKGDKFAVELLSESGYNIGRGVAILIHLLNPETIILGGRGASAGRIWQTPIQQALNEHCIPRLAGNTELEISRLGYDAELIGAAALVMDNYAKERHFLTTHTNN